MEAGEYRVNPMLRLSFLVGGNWTGWEARVEVTLTVVEMRPGVEIEVLMMGEDERWRDVWSG